jgi:hypothetical protein
VLLLVPVTPSSLPAVTSADGCAVGAVLWSHRQQCRLWRHRLSRRRNAADGTRVLPLPPPPLPLPVVR